MRSRPLVFVLAALLGGLFLASCGSKPKVSRIGTVYVDGQQCLFDLAASGIKASSWNAPVAGQCPVSTPISVREAGVRFQPELNSSCALIRHWLLFTDRLNALAIQHLGSPIETVHHYGSYNCRRMTGNSGRMSLHSTARAIDVSGFTTVSGERISVQGDWHNHGAKGRFLRAVARASCDHFNVVLTPNHDYAHRGHFHLDIGPWKLCSV